jgi:hypothetical protein
MLELGDAENSKNKNTMKEIRNFAVEKVIE